MQASCIVGGEGSAKAIGGGGPADTMAGDQKNLLGLGLLSHKLAGQLRGLCRRFSRILQGGSDDQHVLIHIHIYIYIYAYILSPLRSGERLLGLEIVAELPKTGGLIQGCHGSCGSDIH